MTIPPASTHLEPGPALRYLDLIAIAHARLIIGHFRDLDQRQELTFLNAVADIDIDLLHIAGNLRHEIDFLIRLEFSSQHHVVRYVFDGRFRHGNSGYVRRPHLFSLCGLSSRAGTVRRAADYNKVDMACISRGAAKDRSHG